MSASIPSRESLSTRGRPPSRRAPAPGRSGHRCRCPCRLPAARRRADPRTPPRPGGAAPCPPRRRAHRRWAGRNPHVAVRGKLEALAAAFQIAQPGAHRQNVHLAAGIVDVVLAFNPKPDRLQQIGHGERRMRRVDRDRRAAARWGWPRRIPPTPNDPRRHSTCRSGRVLQHLFDSA